MLVLAATNAAALVLVRTQARTRELGLRLALGASHARVLRQLVTESVATTAIRTAVGLAVATLGVSALARAGIAAAIPRLADAAIDGRGLALASGVALAMGLIIGVVPAARLRAVARGGRRTPSDNRATSGRPESRLRRGLVAAQVAIALTLTAAASLLLVAFWELTRPAGLGDARRTLTFRTTLAGTRWSGSPADRVLYDTLLERLRALPGVERAAISTELLQAGDASQSDVVVTGQAPVPAAQRPLASYTMASPDVFRITGSRIERGRGLALDDRPDGPRVAVVNAAFSRAVGLADPIGQRVQMSGLGLEPFEIVGVVANADMLDVGTPEGPRLYYHSAQLPAARVIVLVAFIAGHDPSARAVRDAVRGVDPQLPVLDVATVATLVDQATARPRWGSAVVAAFAAVALALATVGIYGLVA